MGYSVGSMLAIQMAAVSDAALPAAATATPAISSLVFPAPSCNGNSPHADDHAAAIPVVECVVAIHGPDAIRPVFEAHVKSLIR